MDLVVHFKDGSSVTMQDWHTWSKSYEDKNDIVELFAHYKKINKTLDFKNPETGEQQQRKAEDVRSIEIVFK